MIKWKKLLVSFLTACTVIGFSGMGVMAADEPYTYTVTLSAGNMGTVQGQEQVTLSGLSAGQTVSFDLSGVQVTDERYYVKGIRLSGRDNSEALASTAFRVNGDADYVVAYGVKGDMVAYTVNYQDEDGNELAPSVTMYGNVGDKPVVAYRYIEGYVPQALALTGTIGSNEAENVFTFVYTPGESGTVVPPGDGTTGTTTVTTVVTEVVDTAGTGTGTPAGAGAAGTAGAAGAGTGAAAGGAGTAGAGTDTEAGGETTTIPEDETPQAQQPEDIVDIDPEDTPQGNLNVDDASADSESGIPMAVTIIIGLAAVVGLAAIIVVLLRKRLK